MQIRPCTNTQRAKQVHIPHKYIQNFIKLDQILGHNVIKNIYFEYKTDQHSQVIEKLKNKHKMEN